LTNVNFDPQRFVEYISRCVKLRDMLQEKLKTAGREPVFPQGPAHFKPEPSLPGLVKQGEDVGIKSDSTINPDILSLQQTLIIGLKGVAAYASHAAVLGQEDDTVYAFMHEALVATVNKDLSLEDWIGLVLQ